MNFGDAIDALKWGAKVSREGWNGKGMFLYLVKGSFDGSALAQSRVAAKSIEGMRADLYEAGDKGTATRQPHIAMKNASGAHVPWVASQSDMLAEDWEVIYNDSMSGAASGYMAAAASVSTGEERVDPRYAQNGDSGD